MIAYKPHERPREGGEPRSQGAKEPRETKEPRRPTPAEPTIWRTIHDDHEEERVVVDEGRQHDKVDHDQERVHIATGVLAAEPPAEVRRHEATREWVQTHKERE